MPEHDRSEGAAEMENAGLTFAQAARPVAARQGESERLHLASGASPGLSLLLAVLVRTIPSVP